MSRALVAVAAVAVLGAGCGAAESEPNLAAAIDQTQATGSSRFAMSGTESDGQEKAEVACAGEADYDAGHVRLTCDYGGESVELLVIDATAYVRGSLYGLGGSSDKWVKFEDDEDFGKEFSPQALLATLRSASQSTERVGEEQVRGVDTVRYRLVVDCAKAEVSDCEGATDAVDVWIGDDGLVRRIAVEEGSSPFTFEFYDFGAEVEIDAPPADEVVSTEG